MDKNLKLVLVVLALSYQSASALLTDLELYLYSDRYGPTNEKLAVYLAEIFPVAEFGATPAVPHSFRPATLAQL